METSEPSHPATAMHSLQGHLLIAPPDQRDPDFAKAVILVIQHSAEQAVGLVLNRPTAMTVRDLWKSRRQRPSRSHQTVNSGGPVPGPLMALHTCRPLGEIEILPGLYYSVQKDNLEELLQLSGKPFRVYDSHAGWGPGQLDAQVERGMWQTMPATAEHVFHDEVDLWEKLAE